MATATDSDEKSTQTRLLELRNAAIHRRFDELYNKKRRRHDDVLEQLQNEFFITVRTIRAVLKVPPVVPPPAALGEQTEMFPSLGHENTARNPTAS